MIVDTKHGEFEVKDITRKQRRDLYKEVKVVFANQNPEELHDLADEFTLLAFKDEKEAEEKLKGLDAMQEDEVLAKIIVAYMGLDMGNSTGD
jgi:hypothetical protein